MEEVNFSSRDLEKVLEAREEITIEEMQNGRHE